MVDYLSCLDKALVETLKNKSLTITTAESCTGGMVASSIVNISGASDIFKEGYITYSNEAKERILGVKHETLEKYKAVSAETAAQMAEGAVRISKADISVSVTGVQDLQEKMTSLLDLCILDAAIRVRHMLKNVICQATGTR